MPWKNLDRVMNQAQRVPSAAVQASTRAVNRTGEQTRTVLKRLLSEQTGVTQRKIADYIRARRANYGRVEYGLSVYPHTFNIASIGRAYQGKRGVVSHAWGKTRLYPHTFLVHGITAMLRTTKRRLPIRPVYGPRIHSLFANGQTQAALLDNVHSKMPQNLRHELDYALGRIGLKVT